MKTHVSRFIFAMIWIISLCGASAANAGLFRAYLSVSGNDLNPCTLPSPCRLLPAALVAVNDGGEIWMLDSANFNVGPVNITKSVKILAVPGMMGSIVGNGGDALIIDTAGAVTLRNLHILNLSGGVNGVSILNAAAVHIFRTSIDGFNSDVSSCIRLDSATTVRLYIDETFLRFCRNGIFVNGSAVIANRSSVIIDNTRIERLSNSSGVSTVTNGIWMQGFVDVTLSHSVISRADTGVRFENPLGGAASHLVLNHSRIIRTTTALLYSNNVASASGDMSVIGSEFITNTEGINVSNTAVGADTSLSMANSHIAYTGANGVTLANSAADSNTRLSMEMVRSQITNITANAVELAASNGSVTSLVARDAELVHAATGVKTSGSSSNSVSLIRSNLNNLTIAVDHGFGVVRLDGNHVVNCANDFVNNGSGTILSLGNNMVTGNANASGFTYITPTIILGK